MKQMSIFATLALMVSGAAGMAAETEFRHPVAVIPYAATKPVAARDVKLSPDGTWALAASQQQLWLVAVPQFDGKRRDEAPDHKVFGVAPSVSVYAR